MKIYGKPKWNNKARSQRKVVISSPNHGAIIKLKTKANLQWGENPAESRNDRIIKKTCSEINKVCSNEFQW